MITINLLPETYRKSPASSVQRFHRSPLMLLVVGTMAGLVLFLSGVMQIRQVRLAQLTARIQHLEPQKAVVDELRTTVQKLRDQQEVFQRLGHERSQWARRLNLLSDLIPEGAWFTDLSLDQLRGLVIQGFAIGRGGEEMVRIGRLVQDLKADPVFSAMVRDVQIESIKSVQEKEIELVEFTLTGELVTMGQARTTP